MVAIAANDIAVMKVDEAHATMMRLVCIIPAWAVMEGSRRKRIMLRTDDRQGMNTPEHVPCFFGSLWLCAEGTEDDEEFLVELDDSFLAGDDKK